MFSGEEIENRLLAIKTELGCAPELDEMEPNETNLAIYAGGANAVLYGVYRMVERLINDIRNEIDKDNEEAEANRKWLEELKAKEAAKAQGGKDQEAPDAE